MSKRTTPPREDGVMFQLNDRVIVCHGKIMEMMVKGHVPRNKQPLYAHEDWMIGCHGTVIEIKNHDGTNVENIHTLLSSFEDIIIVKVKLDKLDVFSTIYRPNTDMVEEFDMNSLVKISLLGEGVAELVYEESRDKDLPLMKIFQEEFIPEHLSEIVLQHEQDRVNAKYLMFIKSVYMPYHELFAEMVNMNKLYRYAKHKDKADGDE